MKKLFSDRLKFKVMKEDPTLTLLKTVQKYVETIFKREESSEQKKKATTTNSSAIRTRT